MKKRQLIKIVNRLERDITFQETAYHCYNPLNLSGIAEEYLRKKYKVKYFFISDFSFRSYYRSEQKIKHFRQKIEKLFRTKTL